MDLVCGFGLIRCGGGGLVSVLCDFLFWVCFCGLFDVLCSLCLDWWFGWVLRFS